VNAWTGRKTLHHRLVMDRGMSWDAANERLRLEAADTTTAPANGFYTSRNLIYGRRMFILALQKEGQRRTFIIARPNTGLSFFEMDADELRQKYRKVCVCVCVRLGRVCVTVFVCVCEGVCVRVYGSKQSIDRRPLAAIQVKLCVAEPSLVRMQVDSIEDAEQGWGETFDLSLHSCMHGPGCQGGESCQMGRRQTTCSIVTGSVVPIWSALEKVGRLPT